MDIQRGSYCIRKASDSTKKKIKDIEEKRNDLKLRVIILEQQVTNEEKG